MTDLPEDLNANLDDLLTQVEADADDLEDEVETAQRAIAW